jgi:hypothetical protein
MESSKDSTRHTARKNAAKALSERTGMTYTAALRHVTRNGQDRQPRHRWVLTDDVRAWFAGQGWRGIAYPDLYDWLDEEVNPVYECDWCAEDGDAREVDSSLRLVISTYDPDLSPQTAHVATHKYHAACQPSSISWIYKIDIPAGPQRIGLPASTAPDMVGEFDLDVRPVLTPGDQWGQEQAVLLLTAHVVEDHDEGAGPWLSELQLQLGQGFGADWSLRIVTDYPSQLAPQWIALRTGLGDDDGAPHLVLSAVSLPAEWVALARRDQRVMVVLGPCTRHWREFEVSGPVEDELLDDLRGDGPDVLVGCVCSALVPWQVEALFDADSFVAGAVRVAADSEGH